MTVRDRAPFLRHDIEDAIHHLEDYVRNRMRGQVGNLRIVVADSGIILRGYANSYYAKALSQHTVMNVTRTPIVSNEIEVRQAFQKNAITS